LSTFTLLRPSLAFVGESSGSVFVAVISFGFSSTFFSFSAFVFDSPFDFEVCSTFVGFGIGVSALGLGLASAAAAFDFKVDSDLVFALPASGFVLAFVPVSGFDLTFVTMSGFNLTLVPESNFDLTLVPESNFDLTFDPVSAFDLAFVPVSGFDFMFPGSALDLRVASVFAFAAPSNLDFKEVSDFNDFKEFSDFDDFKVVTSLFILAGVSDNTADGVNVDVSVMMGVDDGADVTTGVETMLVSDLSSTLSPSPRSPHIDPVETMKNITYLC
jgi:hypothetical protein